MNKNVEKRIAASLAKPVAMLCALNTDLEAIHAGKTPFTRTGDWRDVALFDATVDCFLWTDVSHNSDDKNRDLMRDIVMRLNAFHLCAEESGLQAEIERWNTAAGKWDEPEVVQQMIGSRHAAVNVLQKQSQPRMPRITLDRKRSINEMWHWATCPKKEASANPARIR